MIIIGIDPGLSTTGFGVMHKQGQKVIMLDYGALRLNAKDTLSYRINVFYDFFTQKIEQWSITCIALETPFLGKNAQNFLKLGYLRGIIYLLAERHKTQVVEFSPREIKKALTGYGAAEKDQVARVIARLFQGFEMPEKLDVTDALAVTLCGLWQSSSHSYQMLAKK